MPGPYKFGPESRRQYKTLDPRLQAICDHVILFFDFAITEGHRNEHRQNAAYLAGKSQVKWPYGRHNSLPSKAMDIYPYPIDWSSNAKNIERNCLLAGMVLATAAALGIPIRWGGDWNMDGDTRDEKFRDYGHFEIDE